MINENKSKTANWQTKKLGEVASYINGRAFKPTEWSKSGFPIIRIQNLNNRESEFNYCNFAIENKYYINAGDLLFAWSGTPDTSFGAHIWKGPRAVLNQHIFKIIINEEIINKQYYLHALNYKVREFINKAHGAAGLAHITKKKFEESEIHLPPLPEQRAIVARIEELLSDLENGKQQLQTAQEQLKIYRQSLLKAAFEGKLTNKNVKEGELPKGWKNATLKDLVDKISDGPFGSHLKSSDYVAEGIRVIRLENIGEMEFRNEYKTYVTPAKYETIKNHTVRKGDIIFSSFISDSIRSTILPDYIDKAINKADCFLVRVSENRINKKYLAFYFSTKAMQHQLVNQIHGATRPRINTTQLKTSLIPFAPLEEQHRIVSILESKLTVCDKIQETITQSLAQAETLRQSILKKAFEGKLVQAGPEIRVKSKAVA